MALLPPLFFSKNDHEHPMCGTKAGKSTMMMTSGGVSESPRKLQFLAAELDKNFPKTPDGAIV
jgi:hypothetical protein